MDGSWAGRRPALLFAEVESRAGGADGGGDGGRRFAIGHDRVARLESGGEAQRLSAEFGMVEGEDRAFGGGDHLLLCGDDQRVMVPDPRLADAGAAENREVGMNLLQRLLAQRA